MCSSAKGLLLAGLLLLQGLTACQPVPRPFQSAVAPPETLALLQPRANSGVLVGPMQGLPPAAARRFAELLAEELQKRDIPASARAGNAQSHILHGRAIVADSRAPVTQLDLAWNLTDPSGLEEGRAMLSERVPGDQLREGRESLLAELAKRAAPRLEAMVRGDPEPGRAAGRRPPIRAFVLPIEPAPGDAAISVARALRAGLLKREILVLGEPAEGAYVVAGSIRLREAGIQDEVIIEWRVLDPSGMVLGTVSQGNFIPKGQLSGPWGQIAILAGEGGAEGVAEILKAVARQARTSSGNPLTQ